ncbi:hypothetical protein ACFL6U_00975 [Planctomycetota bacterium]
MKMAITPIRGALLLIVLTSSILLAQEEQWLQYRYDKDARSIVGGSGARLQLNTEAPEGVKLPKLKGEPLFDQWKTPMVKAGFLHVAVERSTTNGPYDRLYLDRNANGSLADEEALKPYQTDTRSAMWGPVKLVFDSEDGPITYHINLRSYVSDDYRYLYVYAGGWYEGTITLNGKSQACTLVDFNGNGVFNDRSTDLFQADRIRVGDKEKQDLRMVGELLQVDDTLYTLEVAQDGAFVVLDRAQDVTYGQIRVPNNITSFGAGGLQGQFDRIPKEGLVKLPIGKYRIEHWAIDRQDEGAQWQVKGSYVNDKGLFVVAVDQEASLTVGEPLQSSLTVSNDNQKYAVRQKLEGQLGEYIQITRAGKRPRAPKLVVKSKDGKYNRTYNFEYG